MASDVGEFADQILGLLFITFGAGIVWIVLMMMIFRRAAERRRRQREGLGPLPGFWTQAAAWFNQQTQSRTPNSAEQVHLDVPLPELDDLSAPLPSLDDLTSEISELPAAESGAPEPEDTDVYEGEIDYEAEADQDEDELEGEAVPDDEDMPDEEEPVRAVPAAVATVSQTLKYDPTSKSLPEDAVEVLRLWRDLSDGKLIIEMKEARFASAAELMNTKYSERFRNLVRELVNFAVEGGLLAPGTLSNQPAAVKPAPTKPAPESQADAPPSLGIADQIELFLQQRLMAHPDFARHHIHVRPAPDGGVLIEVDDEFYESVSDVMDGEIRAFLEQTMQDWSEHH